MEKIRGKGGENPDFALFSSLRGVLWVLLGSKAIGHDVTPGRERGGNNWNSRKNSKK